MFIKLASKSLRHRKGSVILAVIALTVSVFTLLAVEHIRSQAKQSFSKSVSGVDLIVGARTGSLNLLLYSVFHVGSPTNNISWPSYQKIKNHSQVDWAIPISLGDSHKGYRVMGTSQAFFEKFSYGDKHPLSFKQGWAFEQVFDVVLGAEVAKALGYSLNDTLVLSHGLASTSFSRHDDHPFTVVGVLEPTGTPIDQTLHVSLEGIEAIHVGWQHGIKMPGQAIRAEQAAKIDFTPKSITAFMLGLTSRISTFRVQRDINNYSKEPMSAILPGVALSELWQMMGIIENILMLIAALVFIAALLGLSAMLLSSLRERTNEIRLLRVIGAPPIYLFFLIEFEIIIITLLSLIFGFILLWLSIVVAQDFLISQFGLFISGNVLSKTTALFSLGIIGASLIIGAIPSLGAYFKAKHHSR